ncbi:TAP-like protein-domain-containing protein [Trametes gibbosa]|nr:TAP-like protein-domain-containing protein [Trametes gibbosa]
MKDYYDWGMESEKRRLDPFSVERSYPQTGRTRWFGRMMAFVGLCLVGATLLNRQHCAHVTTGGEHNLGDVKWWPCEGPNTVPGTECGYAIVPLDYLNETAGVAQIALARYKATTSNRKGTVLFNPGGPGGRGKRLASPDFQRLVGEDYDIVGFDPRGIGETKPRTQCFSTPAAHAAFMTNTVLDRGYDVGPNLTDPFTRDHLIQQQRDADALLEAQFKICAKNMGDQLKYMGTTNVARDIAYITSLLEGEDALINFYGFSYGTILGQYLVNMFPDRVGRVVIDGVADAMSWVASPSYTWEKHWLTSTEDAYEIFLSECAKAGPSACALAITDRDTSADILERVETFIDNLYDKPLPAPDAIIPGMLTNGRARMVLLGALQRPPMWPGIAQAFSQAMDGNATALVNAHSHAHSLVDLERSAVSCNDNLPFEAPTPEELIDVQLDVLKHVSRFSLAVISTEPDAGCQYWPVEPNERFVGPWNHTLRNPLLIVSNTADPVTPLSNGRMVHEELKNSSRLLIQTSPGHCSLALPSLCTVGHLRAYFANGTLPADETHCPVDASPFPQLGAARILSAEEEEILEGVRRVSEVVFGN